MTAAPGCHICGGAFDVQNTIQHKNNEEKNTSKADILPSGGQEINLHAFLSFISMV